MTSVEEPAESPPVALKPPATAAAATNTKQQPEIPHKEAEPEANMGISTLQAQSTAQANPQAKDPQDAPPTAPAMANSPANDPQHAPPAAPAVENPPANDPQHAPSAAPAVENPPANDPQHAPPAAPAVENPPAKDPQHAPPAAPAVENPPAKDPQHAQPAAPAVTNSPTATPPPAVPSAVSILRKMVEERQQQPLKKNPFYPRYGTKDTPTGPSYPAVPLDNVASSSTGTAPPLEAKTAGIKPAHLVKPAFEEWQEKCRKGEMVHPLSFVSTAGTSTPPFETVPKPLKTPPPPRKSPEAGTPSSAVPVSPAASTEDTGNMNPPPQPPTVQIQTEYFNRMVGALRNSDQALEKAHEELQQVLGSIGQLNLPGVDLGATLTPTNRFIKHERQRSSSQALSDGTDMKQEPSPTPQTPGTPATGTRRKTVKKERKKTPEPDSEEAGKQREKRQYYRDKYGFTMIAPTDLDIARTLASPGGFDFLAKGIFYTNTFSSTPLPGVTTARFCRTNHANPWLVVVSGDVNSCGECDKRNWEILPMSLPLKSKFWYLKHGFTVGPDGLIGTMVGFGGEKEFQPVPQPCKISTETRTICDSSVWQEGDLFTRPDTTEIPSAINTAYKRGEIFQYYTKHSKGTKPISKQVVAFRKNKSGRPIFTPKFYPDSRELTDECVDKRPAVLKDLMVKKKTKAETFHAQRVLAVYKIDMNEEQIGKIVKKLLGKIKKHPDLNFNPDEHWITGDDVAAYQKNASIDAIAADCGFLVQGRNLVKAPESTGSATLSVPPKKDPPKRKGRAIPGTKVKEENPSDEDGTGDDDNNPATELEKSASKPTAKQEKTAPKRKVGGKDDTDDADKPAPKRKKSAISGISDLSPPPKPADSYWKSGLDSLAAEYHWDKPAMNDEDEDEDILA